MEPTHLLHDVLKTVEEEEETLCANVNKGQTLVLVYSCTISVNVSGGI